MIKKILLCEQDLIDHLRSSANRDPVYGKPEKFPALLVDEIYRHAGDGNFIRTLDLLYRDDVLRLVNQLEYDDVNGNAG